MYSPHVSPTRRPSPSPPPPPVEMEEALSADCPDRLDIIEGAAVSRSRSDSSSSNSSSPGSVDSVELARRQLVDITGGTVDVAQQQNQQLLGNLVSAMVAQQQHQQQQPVFQQQQQQLLDKLLSATVAQQQQQNTMSPQMMIALIEASKGRSGGSASPFVGTLPGVPPPHPPPYNQSAATPPMLQKSSAADKCSAAATTNCTRDGQMPRGPMPNNNKHNNAITNANQLPPPATTAFGNNVSGHNTGSQLLASFGFPVYGPYELLPRLLSALQQSPPAAITKGQFGCHFVPPQLHPNNANGTKQSPQLNQQLCHHLGNTGAIGKGSSPWKRSKSLKTVTFACEGAKVDELDIAIAKSMDVQTVGLDEEMRRMGEAIATAMAHIGHLQKRSRQTTGGMRLEVNDNILDACIGLMNAVRVLVIRCAEVQEEIVAQGKAAASPSEFYKRSHLWTGEGLILAGPAVAVAARELVKSADNIIMGKGGAFEHLIVAAGSVAASVGRLFVSPRVKAASSEKDSSEKLVDVCKASKAVNLCTAGLVKTVKSGQQQLLAAEEHDVLDFSNLSLHETKEAEMKSQVRGVLELKSELTNERRRFVELRKQHETTWPPC